MRRGLLDAASDLPNPTNLREGVDTIHFIAKLSSHGCDFRTYVTDIVSTTTSN